MHFTRTHPDIHAHMHPHTHTYIHTFRIHTHEHTDTDTCMYVTHTYMHARETCMRACIHTTHKTCMDTHTHQTRMDILQTQAQVGVARRNVHISSRCEGFFQADVWLRASNVCVCSVSDMPIIMRRIIRDLFTEACRYGDGYVCMHVYYEYMHRTRGGEAAVRGVGRSKRRKGKMGAPIQRSV